VFPFLPNGKIDAGDEARLKRRTRLMASTVSTKAVEEARVEFASEALPEPLQRHLGVGSIAGRPKVPRAMKVFLLHRDRDFQVKPELHDAVFAAMHSSNPFAVDYVKRNLERERAQNARFFKRKPTNDETLTQDLELTTLWRAMADGDDFLFEAAKRVTLSSLTDPDTIRYRQQILADCLQHPEIIRQLYAFALEALESERKVGSLWSGAQPAWVLHRSVQVLQLHLDVLKRLRQLADEQSTNFHSEGFRRFYTMLREELSNSYLETVEQHLQKLQFGHGLLQSAQLGKGHKARHYTVHDQPPPPPSTWRQRFVRKQTDTDPAYSFELHPLDVAGFRALDEIRSKGLNEVANVVAQSADHIKSFFAMLHVELAFYLGCVNLHTHLLEHGESTCFPDPRPPGQDAFTAEGLYDVCLALHLDTQVVGNDVRADGKRLVVITGANQGGKSTLLRSVGLAQLMMQAGMFVGARAYSADIRKGIFTHYKREEDAAMEGGKLDEELGRMSTIAEEITFGAILLCNESFASTNEREGSEIARQVVRAFLAKHIRLFLVTHMYDLAHGLFAQPPAPALFLRAERRADGTRTFKLTEGKPLPTSYGEDSYRRIFKAGREAEPASFAQ
jgi:hypothetical protein